MASSKKSMNSRKKFSASGKRPLKKRGPYKPRASRTPLAQALKEKIAEKAEAILDSTSSPEPLPSPPTAPGPAPIAPDTDLEKLRKEKEKADYADREKVRKSKQTKKTRGRPPRPEPTKEGVLALLRLPFQVGGAITGFNQDPIHPAVEDTLAESAIVVMRDFGFEAVQKWINLGVFAALYGTCGLTWFKGMQTWAEEQQRAAVEAKKAKIHDITPPKSADASKAV